MNVLIIGAAGRTGALSVVRALAAGHAVTALVRHAHAYHPPAGVRVLEGDATDSTALGEAMVGQDVVIDTVGGKTPFRDTTLERDIAWATVEAMRQNGVGRLIVVSALGVGDSAVQGSFFFRYVVLPLFLRGSTKDKEAMERIVRESGVEFVLVRPAVLNDRKAKGSVQIVPPGAKAHQVTRDDVAQFLVDQIEGQDFLGRAVTIANS